MTRNALHALAVEAVITRLRRRGFTVARTPRNNQTRNPGDLVVNGLTVGVLVSRPGTNIHRVNYRRTNGTRRKYEYTEHVFHWNAHSRGVPRVGVQCWILAALTDTRTTLFVLPSSVNLAKTLRVSVNTLRHHWLWEYKDNFTALKARRMVA